jgi:hypothetical protein
MWTVRKGIATPKGVYVPKSDNLKAELVAAAKFAGLEAFNVKIDGKYFEPEELPTNSIESLIQSVGVEAVETVARDTAGR